jgi:hypothetical protein
MPELDAGDRILLLDEFGEPAERLDEGVVPDAEIADRAAARRSTFVDSTTTSPAPPAANLPAFIRCQSVGKPFRAEYWCIGGTTIRLRNSTLRIVIGENSRVPDMFCFLASPTS